MAEKEHHIGPHPTSSAEEVEPKAIVDDDAQSSPSTSRAGADLPTSEHNKPVFTIGQNGREEVVDEEDPRIREIPPYVRRVVSLTDDTTELTITFRYFLLTAIFVCPGAFLSQMSSYRTTYAPYSVFFVQIASNYVGTWLAKVLPAWRVRIPGTPWAFSLNPGSFSTKEHVLVTIAAASGATYNLAYTPISMSQLYFGHIIHPAAAIFFMLGIVWVGYSYAALARQFLIHDPSYPWFFSICQSALFETQRKDRESPTKRSRKQMRVFFGVLLGVTLWQFLPEYVFPMLGSLAFLCWVAPRNPVANFVGAGFGGMAFLNISLDWSSIVPMFSPFLTPFWTQVIAFAAFAFNCWVLLPAAQWGNLAQWNHHLMSNRLFLENGTKYPVTDLMTPDVRFNLTAYENLGTVHSGAQFLWATFFDYAAYSSALVWMALFGYGKFKESIHKMAERRRISQAAGAAGKKQLAHQYNDQLNILQRAYDDVPLWWYGMLFLASFVAMLVPIAKGLLFVPVWIFLVAIATGAVVVIPLGWLYALSNYQVPIGTTNELFYGLMVNAVAGHKNPCGASTYGAIAGDAWYRAQYMLQDMKIGHYMHVPPKTVFFSQLYGSLLGVPINYGVIRWVLNTKADYLKGTLEDPTHQWTGQSLANYLSIGVQYVLIGPRRLFQEPLFRPLPYGFLLGAGAPVVIFALHSLFPTSKFKFHLWNTTIFFSMLAQFYGNISTGYTSSFLIGAFVMYWGFRYRHDLWARWNYIFAAAFDAGFNFNMLLIFLCFGAGKVITMPHWWGNNADSSERCFALGDDG